MGRTGEKRKKKYFRKGKKLDKLCFFLYDVEGERLWTGFWNKHCCMIFTGNF